MNFTEFNFEKALAESLDSMGFETATPIQEKAIPIILSGKDLIACAQTGTGKTAAFLLPVLNSILKSRVDNTDTLIVVPTRELAVQIDQVLQGFSYFTNVSSIAIYGGNDGKAFEQEKKALESKANIFIATPGRLIAHLNMGYVRFESVRHFILDEADRMLDMGFFEDILKISGYLPKERQTLMFSATMPSEIRKLAQKLLVNPEQVNIALAKPAEGVLQAVYEVAENQKVALLEKLLHGKDDLSVIIFASTKIKVREIEKALILRHFRIRSIHSDLEQQERESALIEFKAKNINIIVATDVLARGIDIDDVGLIVNFDVPGAAEDYVHRVGRTARAAATGVALTFVSRVEQGKFKRIEQLIGVQIRRINLPEGLPEPAIEVMSPRSFHGRPRPQGHGQRNDRSSHRSGSGNNRHNRKGN